MATMKGRQMVLQSLKLSTHQNEGMGHVTFSKIIQMIILDMNMNMYVMIGMYSPVLYVPVNMDIYLLWVGCSSNCYFQEQFQLWNHERKSP